MHKVELGLGLLSIGRQWGVKAVHPPKEDAAHALLEAAYSNGISFFDTAPAYACSEAILGRALSSGLLPRDEITIATKMGEHWYPAEEAARTGHSFDELVRSLDNSMRLLGRVDLLQLHKATAANVASRDVIKAFDRAASMGITRFGASVSDLETATIACKSGRYHYLQFPFNINNRSLEPVFELLAVHGMNAIVNRPFAMGALVQEDSTISSTELFRSIVSIGFAGVILTGTSSISHLLANVAAFQGACS
ncbi:aldo/keto reductase [Rhizobium lemnae]|uniref:Aldo/keto reductase n=1 Tax=Rhizobium lemnae TaxID=1214924 RepID=A0ABV8EBZ1_9HYPH|nr:aldo/keto reductase [Rhizobium lemnae]MCJ8507438.1 aldo/keto reductase [Rhizobium lemnae]